MARRREMTSLGGVVDLFDRGEITLWRHNREINERRAQDIAAYYAANNFDGGPQPLVVGELPDGSKYLIDGQHRVRAGYHLGAAARQVEVELVYERCADDAALRKLFRLLNIGTPVPLRYYDEEVAAFTSATIPLIKQKWPGAYSQAGAASRPWYTNESLQRHLGSARCREAIMLGVMTPARFIEELEAVCVDVERDFKNNVDAAARRHAVTGARTAYYKALDKKFCAGVMLDWGDATASRIIGRHAGV